MLKPLWDALKTLELNPKMLELRVVLGWPVCYTQVRAALVCTQAVLDISNNSET